MNKFD